MQSLRGLNPKDTLTDKAAKLVQQSQLLHTPQGKATLAAQGLPENPLPASIVHGIGFFPQGFHTFEPPLNPYGWRGVYIQDWAEYRFERQETRYHLLDRMAYLAPARVAETETLNETEIRRIDQGLIAILELRPDGFWHEIERIMKAVSKPFTNFKRTHYIMNAAQLDHTAKVLAEMLTFKQPSDAVLSAYFREHKKLGRQDRHEIAETAFAALRHYQKISTALRRPPRAAAQSRSRRTGSRQKHQHQPNQRPA